LILIGRYSFGSGRFAVWRDGRPSGIAGWSDWPPARLVVLKWILMQLCRRTDRVAAK